MSEQLFIRLRNRIQGPFTVEQLQSLAKRGQFSRTHEISSDGTSWTRAMSRSDLFPPPKAEPIADVAAEEATSGSQHAPAAADGPPRADVWYYHQLGVNQGPVEFSHLQYLASVGQISAEDLVWKEGMPEWLPAARVPNLIKANAASFADGSPTAAVYVGSGGPAPHASSEFPRVSGMSVASLVLGILWICGIGSILAIVFGAVAIYQIRLARGRLTGTGLAVAGLVLGIVFLSVQIFFTIAGATVPSGSF